MTLALAFLFVSAQQQVSRWLRIHLLTETQNQKGCILQGFGCHLTLTLGLSLVKKTGGIARLDNGGMSHP